jgi:hypothetical protein
MVFAGLFSGGGYWTFASTIEPEPGTRGSSCHPADTQNLQERFAAAERCLFADWLAFVAHDFPLLKSR